MSRPNPDAIIRGLPSIRREEFEPEEREERRRLGSGPLGRTPVLLDEIDERIAEERERVDSKERILGQLPSFRDLPPLETEIGGIRLPTHREGDDDPEVRRQLSTGDFLVNLGQDIIATFLLGNEITRDGVRRRNLSASKALWQSVGEEITRAAAAIMSFPSDAYDLYSRQAERIRFVQGFDDSTTGWDMPFKAFASLTEDLAGIARTTSERLSEERVAHMVEAGYSDEAIRNVAYGGAFIGTATPAVAALRIAAYARRVKSAVPTSIIDDFAAGFLFGLTTTDADFETRAVQAAEEMAWWGGAGLILRGGLSLIQWRNSRRYANARGVDTDAVIGLLNEGPQNRIITRGEDGKLLAQIVSEENFVMRNPMARNLLEESADSRAFIASLTELPNVNFEYGIMRNAVSAEKIKAAAESSLVQRLGKKHGFEINVLDNPRTGAKDIIWTQGKFHKKKIDHFNKYGFFGGQKVQYKSTEWEYVGRDPRNKSSKVRIKHETTGKKVVVPESMISDMPVGAISDARRPLFYDDLYSEFREFYTEFIGRMKASRKRMTEDEIATAIRNGEFDVLDLNAKRMIPPQSGVLLPEEAGLGTDIPFPTLLPGERINMLPAREEATFEHVFDLFLKEKLDSFRATGRFDPGSPVEVARIQTTAMIDLPIEEIAEMAASAPARGLPPGELLSPIAETGLDAVAPTIYNLKQVRSQFTDVIPLRSHFAARLTKDLEDSLPVADREVLERMRTFHAEIAFDGAPTNLDFEAAVRGFSVHRTATGKAVWIRDMDTGQRFAFADESVAGDFVRNYTGHIGLPSAFPDFLPPNFAGKGLMLEAPNTGPTSGFFVDPKTVKWDTLIDEGSPVFTNLRDYLVRLEKKSNFPFFTKIFDPLQKSNSIMNQGMAPWMDRLGSIWDGVKATDRNRIAQFWREVEYEPLSKSARARMMREREFTPKMIRAEHEARKLWNTMGRAAGLNEDQIIPGYFARIQPYAAQHGGTPPSARNFKGDPNRRELSEFIDTFYAEARTGEMSAIETDPLVVMAKWVRKWQFNTHMKEPWERAAKLINYRHTMARKPGERKGKTIERGIGEIYPELSDEVTQLLGEFMSQMRGIPSQSVEKFNRLWANFLKPLGIKPNHELIGELGSQIMSTMYGATLGARLLAVARNMTQSLYMGYTRYGGRYMNSSLVDALDPNKFAEVVREGVIHQPLREAGGLAMEESLRLSRRPPVELLRGDQAGLKDKAFAKTLETAMATGGFTKKVSSKMLLPYTSSDEMQRAWMYWWTKTHTDDVLRRFESGRISQAKFLDDGLPFFDDVVKNEFLRVYKAEGRERALRYIGRQGSNEANFIYGGMYQTPWLQHPFGRAIGMFGTWPLWLKELYFNRARNGTPAQVAALAARTAAVSAAFGWTAHQTGINMMSWIAPFSFNYSFGPSYDLINDARRVVGSPMDEKEDAFIALAASIGSLFTPGSGLYRDITHALNSSDDPLHQLYTFGLGRPIDRDFGHRSFETLFKQMQISNGVEQEDMSQSTREWLDSFEGFMNPRPRPPMQRPPSGINEMPQLQMPTPSQSSGGSFEMPGSGGSPNAPPPEFMRQFFGVDRPSDLPSASQGSRRP